MTVRVLSARALPRTCRPSPLSAALALALAAPLGAIAQTPTLQETVVTATRVETPLSQLVSDVSVIDRQTIENSGATGVADLLARLPGVQIVRNGGIGNTTGVFLRGAETRFTAVYLDGVRIDSQSTGGATWEALPLSQIERIEVLRGPAAAVYGSDAIGGVVQLFTRKGEGGFAPYASVGAGSRATHDAQAGFSGAAGGFDYSVGTAYAESRGFDVRTPNVNHNPDADLYRSTSANARLGYQINAQHRVEATVLENNTNAGYDATSGSSYRPATATDDRSLYHLRTAGLGWTAQWTEHWKTLLQVTDSSSRYETTSARVAAGYAGRPTTTYITETQLRGYLLQNDLTYGAHRVTAALERREDELTNPSLTDWRRTLRRDRAQDAVALGYGYHQGAHTVQLNLRHDDDSEFGGKTTGSASYGYEFVKNWRATVSAGTAFRAPTLYQRFSEYGDASLKPETGRNAEVGLRYGDGRTNASLVVFENRVRNLIVFTGTNTACGQPFGCYASIGRAVYQGATLAADHRFGEHFTLRGSLDVQDPKDSDTGLQLPRRAKRYANLAGDWTQGIWTVGAEVQLSSRRFDDTANKVPLAGYGLLNLYASVQLRPDLRLLARLDNATDKNYVLANNYATAGRTAYVGLKWTPR
ncbi:TonB-dependent receptor domain-containing protein [Pseudacidovorax intermedius]|uniref:TonB-dependent receptor n=1 Tax=Pseudacidovorax intermedius TaxID=433924 RepID=A0A147GMV5_9BURK|nr:TonB-dependent receptor [Pseudacidovorax intermedius]KTT15186.1 TonB-dependent receptor [Pseudacidovorax intermedius]